MLWLEGADDLTPEAQAFLRRILETHANDVLFILECRDAGRLQEPIRSRCTIKKMMPPTWLELESYLTSSFPSAHHQEIKDYLHPNEYSYRRIKQCVHLQQQYPEMWRRTIEHRKQEKKEIEHLTPHDVIRYIKQGYHPELLTTSLLSNESILKDYGDCIELSGSLWAFLGSALDKVHTTTMKQEE
jgi:hypothetical protein